MSDFRVDTGYFRHVKTKRLKRELGLEGVVMLQMLWAYAAENKHGCDTVYTSDDIELAVDCTLAAGKFTAILAAVGFIDAVEGGYVLHEWEHHNGFAATANAREEKARAAANARWEKKNCKDDTVAMPKDLRADAKSCNEHMLNSACSNAPSPSPSPSPSPKKESALCDRPQPEPVSAPVGAAQAQRGKRFDSQDWFERFWEAFGDKRGRAPAQISWRKIKGLDRQLAETIVAAAGTYARQRIDIVARNGTPKMAQGWLNDRRWEDDAAAVVGETQVMSPELAAAFSKVMEGSDVRESV